MSVGPGRGRCCFALGFCGLVRVSHTEESKDRFMNREVILYSAKLCGDCQLLKSFMDANGVVYELRDIREQPEYLEELARRNSHGVACTDRPAR